MAKERKKNEISIASEGTVEEVVEEHNSMKKKKKNRENSGEDEEIATIEGEKSKKEKITDSEGEDVVKKSKNKHMKTKVDSEAEESVKKSKKKPKKTKVDLESDGGEIGNSASSKVRVLSSEENQKDGNKKTKKRKRDGSVLGAEENTDKEIERKRKKKKPNVDSELEETNLTKKKSKEKEPIENSEPAKNIKEKKTQSEDPEAEAKKKRKQKQKCSESDKDVTTPSNKSTKKVKFSDQVEVFPAEDEESEEEDEKDAEEEEEVKLVRGKRFSKEEDALVKKAVLDYIDNHALGDKGLEMVLNCKAHPQIKGCWKEIGTALPWRPYTSVYFRAHSVFEEGSKGVWTEEDIKLVKDFQKKHGNDWKTLAEAMGKNRVHVKDAWRRTRFNSNKGHWSRQEYQTLFDLVNKDIRMKAFKDKHSRHGMLRDNIPWMAVSDELGTRNHLLCCQKWYDQLLSPMVVEGTWANVDDYRLLEELMKLDAACIDDVDWDYLLENRDGETCRKRWNQMVHHIGTPGTKTFAEQVEILSERYCPELAEDREDFDNRPYDPED